MGTLTLPPSGLVYVDSMIVIYSVERYPTYWPVLQSLWMAAQAGGIDVVTSELTILETFVGPYQRGTSAASVLLPGFAVDVSAVLDAD